MHINLKLNITSSEEELLNSLITSENLELTSSQLYNFCIFIDVIKKSKDIKKTIKNHNNILQACNYETDENCEYWIILDKKYNFTDIGIPLNLEVDKPFENIPEFESNIIRDIKKYTT
jgi:hypothetical protein